MPILQSKCVEIYMETCYNKVHGITAGHGYLFIYGRIFLIREVIK